ncbi:hypothetical protein [Arenimonas terrae]|uniref:Baseplate assembly protein n=1 Tax=Arenimonas terrae TaxID=2546226 RepID=A0A5C4RXK0_9GAMM|nr:hypothetical protein [Arenimonas terrae]TNJ35441.1 hypothetical protein E1B00_06710 [Arenimonas terrae]
MDTPLNDCGCCADSAPLPGPRFNAPGLPAIHYRIGRHGEFKAAMLSSLSSTRHPALAGLRTREHDDFSIALCDAGAVMFDVLGFYQERIANEAYLRTAVERRSILELGRLIGYTLSPGLAASTHLAFLLEDAPGLPSLAARPVTVPVGTRVQSIPGENEQPQTFETTEAVVARVAWNAMPVRTREPQRLVAGTRELLVRGIATQVQPGDVVLIVGDERDRDDAESEQWDARVVTAVDADPEAGLTRLRWADGLGDNNTVPAGRGVRAYVFRSRTALFGHNASDARLMRLTADLPGLTEADPNVAGARRWKDFAIIGSDIDLDGAFPKVVAGSWFLLAGGGTAPGSASLPGWVELYKAERVTQRSRSGFGLSGKITRLVPDTDKNLDQFRNRLRETVVFAQSEELPLAERPLAYPLYGSLLPLPHRDEQLVRGQVLAVSGQRQRIAIRTDTDTHAFQPDGAAPVGLKPGDSYVVLASPRKLDGGTEEPVAPEELDELLRSDSGQILRWRLADRQSREGRLDAPASAVALAAARKDDPVHSELVAIDTLGIAADQGSQVQLKDALANVYDRRSVTVCGNVAPATHGESVSELAGSGNAAQADQRFLLKQAPLTQVSAGTPSGRRATLVVRVNGEAWEEVPSLYGRGANDHVYSLRQDDEQRTVVQFGDGSEGARLPTGRDNLRFGYRKGLGAEGNVRAGQLTTLLGRPLGVKSVLNPAPAGGGQDPESRDDARRNAPLTTLTLGRAVSLQDYSDFARSFAGISKALAVWARFGGRRGIFLSLAGPAGAAVPANGATLANLQQALRHYGDPLLPLWLHSYGAATFRIRARIKVSAAMEVEPVLAHVAAALREHYGFARRDFAQAASIDEAMAVAHRVAGVDAVDIDQFYRLDPGAMPALVPRLFALPPKVLANGSLRPGEILTLATGPSGLVLEVMP